MEKKKNAIMAHLVSHFPNEECSYRIAMELACRGASYLEIQFPFTDPIADGAIIQKACTRALQSPDPFTVEKGFRLIGNLRDSLRAQQKDTPLLVMTYGNVAFVHKVEVFVSRLGKCGVEGIIVPDIPFDSDVGIRIQAACRDARICYVPVTVVGSPRDRVRKLIEHTEPRYLYLALRVGITGEDTVLTKYHYSFLSDELFRGIKIFGGFGIRNAHTIKALSGHVHACVVGSAFAQAIDEAIGETESIDPFSVVQRVARRYETLHT